ncbi:ATP-grasp domain-containing protein [Georgenia sp. Z1344]|uniref:carboxylate--amine ligase n=1 Tax=Georgenia sp. Z1344 TaxID=3416706 RepID=UPI003CF69350
MRHADLRPVVLGSDLGTYSVARSFHEAFGVRSTIVLNQPRGPVDHSAILEQLYLGKGGTLDTDLVLDRLIEHAAAHPERRHVLMPTMDQDVDLMLTHRERLEEHYLVGLAPAELVRAASDKANLERVAASAAVATPRGVEVPIPGDDDEWRRALAEVPLPAILKPADGGTTYANLFFEGRKKAYPVADHEESLEVLQLVRSAGFTGTFLAQELIPGDDTTTWVVNGYVDQAGRMTMAATGQVLLGLHQPGFIGNAGIIYVREHPELLEDARRVVGELGLTGLFSIDVKIDPRDGRRVLLDVNPRAGRGGYFVDVGGLNLMAALVADRVEGRALPERVAERRGVMGFVPSVVLPRYVRDRALLREVLGVIARRGVVNPLLYRKDRNLRRALYARQAGINQLRALAAHYPRPTDTGF